MENLLVLAGQTLAISFHTYDPNQSPPVPLSIDSDYNGGMPYITVLQNDSPVDSTVFGLYVEVPGCWGIVVNPNSADPAQDTVATSAPNRYGVQFTPNSSQGGLFQIVAIAQVNGYEGCAVIGTVQVGPVAANAANLPADFLSSEEQLQLATLTSETIGNAAIKSAIGTPQQSGSAVMLPNIPANWLTAAGIAASALNGKGDWNTTTPPTASAIASAVWTLANAIEGAYTPTQVMQWLLAMLAGKLTTAGQNPEIFKNPAGTQTRVSIANDSSGNRTSVTLT